MTSKTQINHKQLQDIFSTKRISGISAALLLQLALILLFSFPTILSAEPVQPSSQDRCPICGMFVAPFPNWIAQIEFNDGTREFFDGPKDMFRYYLNLKKNDSTHSKESITGIYVTEYYSTKMMHVDELFFVTGSDIMGPMGKELIPVHTKEAAESFKQEHKGKALFTFEQVTNDIISGF